MNEFEFDDMIQSMTTVDIAAYILANAHELSQFELSHAAQVLAADYIDQHETLEDKMLDPDEQEYNG